MAQNIFSSINPAATSGTQLATILDDFKEALMSGLAGTSRPTELDPGGGWIDTSNEGTPDFYWIYNIYTGTVDVEIFRVNLVTNKASISGADSTFEVSRITADSVGALMKLIKERIANNGQVLDGDVVGEVQFVGCDSAGSNPVVARIKSLATDNMTPSASGAVLVFEATSDATASVAEMMRLKDGALGIGTTTPLSSLHAKGATGIRDQRQTDDAVGAQLIMHKSRLTLPEVQNADVIGALKYKTTDEAAAEATSAEIDAVATEAHSSTAQGTQLRLKATKTGEVALTTHMTIGDVIEAISRFDINSLLLKSADVATAASITALSASKALINFTGSTATSLKGILSTSTTKVVVLHNRSTAPITLEHEDAGATAADRLKLPDSLPIEILPESSMELFYSTSDSRWKVKSGSGSGGGGLRISSLETLTGGGTISSSTTAFRQMRHIQGTSGPTTLSNTPFGTGGAWKDGTEMTLVGNSDDNTVVIDYNDAANGVVGNFSSIEIGKYKIVELVWSASLSRWIMKGNN